MVFCDRELCFILCFQGEKNIPFYQLGGYCASKNWVKVVIRNNSTQLN